MSPLAQETFDSIPDPIREPFKNVALETTWLHAKWNVYSQLFQAGPEQLALPDATAPSCFRIIHDCMKNDIFLTLARLTDPASSSGRSNLSLPRLMSLLSEVGRADIVGQCKETLEALNDVCKPIRTRRNRRLAHTDMATSLNLETWPLPLIPPDLVNKALTLVREILNTVEGAFRESETAYQAVMLRGDGKTLLHFLRRGLDASDAERNQMLARLRKPNHK